MELGLSLMRRRRIDKAALRVLTARASRQWNPLREDLDRLCEVYQSLTRRPANGPVRRLLAIAWEVHGPVTEDLVKRLWERAGTDNNLIAAVIAVPSVGGDEAGPDQAAAASTARSRSSDSPRGEMTPISDVISSFNLRDHDAQ